MLNWQSTFVARTLPVARHFCEPNYVAGWKVALAKRSVDVRPRHALAKPGCQTNPYLRRWRL